MRTAAILLALVLSSCCDPSDVVSDAGIEAGPDLDIRHCYASPTCVQSEDEAKRTRDGATE